MFYWDEIKIEGLKELDNRLKNLPFKVQKKVLNAAVRSGATIIKKEAKQRVPVRSGFLKKNILVRKKKKQPIDKPIYQVGCSNKAWYGRIIEFGSRMVAARPWLRPAFDVSKQKVLDQIRKKLKIGIEREAAKLAR